MMRAPMRIDQSCRHKNLALRLSLRNLSVKVWNQASGLHTAVR